MALTTAEGGKLRESVTYECRMQGLKRWGMGKWGRGEVGGNDLAGNNNSNP